MKKKKSRKIRVNPLFKRGSSVEVRSTDPGLHGSWYEAAIISEIPKRLRSRLTVQYKTLLSPPHSSERSKKLKASTFHKEKVHMTLIRPPSPCERHRNGIFEAFEEVEVYHNDGWWPGVILKKMDEIGDDGSFNYSVEFSLSREVFAFGAYDLRKKMVWVADEQGYSWKSAGHLCNFDHDNEEEIYKTTFHVGAQVEVSYDKDIHGAKNPSSLKDKYDVVCPKGILNESVYDKGNGMALSKANITKNGSVFSEGYEPALSFQRTSNNLESPVSIELVDSTKQVLRLFPQNPHFQPLLLCEEEMKEGMICGLVIAFTKLVDGIKRLTICSSDQEFEKKFKALDNIEEYGFNTEQARAPFKDLKALRDKLAESQDKANLTLSEVEELKKTMKMDVLEMSKIEEEIARLQARKGKMVLEAKAKKVKVEELGSVAMAVEDESMVLKDKFQERMKSLLR